MHRQECDGRSIHVSPLSRGKHNSSGALASARTSTAQDSGSQRCLSAVVSGSRRTNHLLVAPGSEEPSHKIELVFSAYDPITQDGDGGTPAPLQCLSPTRRIDKSPQNHFARLYRRTGLTLSPAFGGPIYMLRYLGRLHSTGPFPIAVC
jgi:hypothetical protein